MHLPRLELRLRVTQPAALAEQLPGLLAEAARQALALALPAAGAAPTADAAGGAERRLERYLRQGDLPWPDAWREAAERCFSWSNRDAILLLGEAATPS